MLSVERLVKKGSDYYLYTPSIPAKELMLYPTVLGRFTYEPGYRVHRTHFDSFLLMFVEEGNIELSLDDTLLTARKGQLVLVDCYHEHLYGSKGGSTVLWIHFAGTMARKWYDYIKQHNGNIVTPSDGEHIRYNMNALYHRFREHKTVSEARMSGTIAFILSGMLMSDMQEQSLHRQSGIQEAVTWIGEHFAEPIQLQDMAEVAALSPYYFSRLFTKETGFTPHPYLISTRISAAKYMLSTTSDSVKEIGFKTGFTDESSFCSTFRKREGLTPSAYRNIQHSYNRNSG